MLDPQKIEGTLRNQERYQRYLNDIAHASREAYLSDPVIIGASRYYLIAAIECCLDTAQHIISTRRFRSPSDYADAFQVLCEEGILPQALTGQLQKMARFRNLLVHQYGRIDDLQVYEFLQHDLSDFSDFVAQILNYIDK